MCKDTAILVDGEWYRHRIIDILNRQDRSISIDAKMMYDCSMATLTEEDEIFRLFYYDAMPFIGKRNHPVTKNEIDFSMTSSSIMMRRFNKEFSALDYTALRLGKGVILA